jgi:hypothetical protein
MILRHGAPLPSSDLNRASDHVTLASKDRAKPVVPDELVSWFQGIMVLNQPQPPRLLETMSDRCHQQLGTHEKLTLKPAVAPWEVGTMEH